MANELFISDKRMLDLMDWAIKNGVAANESEYLEKIKFPRTNISNVRKGLQGFTKEQIFRACELTGASADFLFGFQNAMMRKTPKKGIELLKEAVLAVEQELQQKKLKTKPVKPGKTLSKSLQA